MTNEIDIQMKARSSRSIQLRYSLKAIGLKAKMKIDLEKAQGMI
jgi:hypothetical protein